MHRVVKKLYKHAEELYIHRRTRGTIKDAAVRLEGVQNAWLDAGPVPEYHEGMKDKLRTEWPALADAIERACK